MTKNSIAAGLFLFAALLLSRWLPHPPNMTPLVAISLWAGLFLGSRAWGAVLPLAAMLLVDIFIGFHTSMFFVYGSVLLISMAGGALGVEKGLARWGAGTFAGSALFFAVTNFGVWALDGLYPLTAQGLAQCFLAALPFWGNHLISDFGFSAVLYLTFHFIYQRRSTSIPAQVRS